jgi:hypothetical protein
MTRKTDTRPIESAASPLSRRTLFAGAGTVGALAAAAAVLPGTKAVQTVAASASPSNQADGYQLTEHVKRYYQTARV